MERCPCCKARLAGATLCPRCQADLASVLACAKMAQQWLVNAIRLWHARELKMAILALSKSLYLKQTPLALAFREHIIREQCQFVLGLLQKKEYAVARESLALLNDLNPHHKLLKQLSRFSKYLSVKDMIESPAQQVKAMQPNKMINEHKTS
jgi:hypothetical protein